jgi:serine/threonine-protein kinase
MQEYRIVFGVPLMLLATAPPVFAQDNSRDKAQLAAQARRVLEIYCHRCHKGEGSESGSDADFLKRADLVAPREGEKPFVSPGKPQESFLFERMAVRRKGKGDMPPAGIPDRPSDADRAIVKKWIQAEAPDFPQEQARPVVGLAAVLTAIRDDLIKAKPRERPHLRYFTLTHLHNNPAVRASHLRLVRAALSKALHSLSWKPVIVRPRTLDPAQTVLAVDLRKLGWGRDHWRALLQAYPYGLLYDSHPDVRLKDVDRDIHRLNGRAEELIHLRADWFVATATRPPLYHTLLYELHLPELRRRPADPKHPANVKRMTARDLEDYLDVPVTANLMASEPRARRAGFPRSGVSSQNRLIERHPLRRDDAYWKSYDFKASTWEANLLQFPLGPRFARNPFKDLAFVHDGGEIIFHLPNGLQGYLLVSGQGERMDAGPIEVVSDHLKTSGTPAIVNGLSCMACHRHGMINPPRDLVRDGAGVFNRARERVRLLYPKADEMNRLVREDGSRFLKALKQAVGEFLKVGPDRDRPIKEFSEPVGEVARKYLLEDLDLTAVACELYVADPKRLRQQIKDSDDLRTLGLGALTRERGLIKRGAWEAVRGTSQMQQAARELGFTPFLVASGR